MATIPPDEIQQLFDQVRSSSIDVMNELPNFVHHRYLESGAFIHPLLPIAEHYEGKDLFDRQGRIQSAKFRFTGVCDYCFARVEHVHSTAGEGVWEVKGVPGKQSS